MVSEAWVSVLIPAHNAEETVGRAVHSALAQPEVAEVIVVDDASSDRTAEVARASLDDGRLKVIQLTENLGPSAARNIALEASTADYVAPLDADDLFLPGRFRHLATALPSDMVADNILFFDEPGPVPQPIDEEKEWLTTRLRPAAFVRGDIAKPGHNRSELGFLKPIMSRAFLDRHKLRYDESLRLGEDYIFYLRMLLHGARFHLTQHPGYAAMVRAGSLSARHRTADLFALAAAEREVLHNAAPKWRLARTIRRHIRETERRAFLRAFLDVKAEKGRIHALAHAFSRPRRTLPIVRGVLHDKLWSGRDLVRTPTLLPLNAGQSAFPR